MKSEIIHYSLFTIHYFFTNFAPRLRTAVVTRDYFIVHQNKN